MRNLLLAVGFMLIALSIQGQNLRGAWEHYHTTDQGQEIHQVVIFADGYQVLTIYDAKTGAFIHTNGGLWSLKGNTLTETVEFNSDNPEAVGNSISFDIRLTDKELQIVGDDRVFTRIDDGTPGALNGAWLMSGRKRNGEMQERDTTRPRKTMKILSGTRFQWIAYNTETKQFMATGGGSYTTVDGKYTENIEFFSRDVARVGAALAFDFELIDGHWHHSGFSSKGDPLYEVWSVRNPQ
ncbi:membrane or secreted protein [Gilvibacter sediminis]|uniref:membrane or secreted protein n=1 Tax=Gilvibacter sediminis TaxID=379071 RepID=UPI0023509EA7|nr:membrane or secreted protein [Gilvibacter sediminis]MDC7997933.1 membrane or secreted protein [Gilvibacter sediminis]